MSTAVQTELTNQLIRKEHASAKLGYRVALYSPCERYRYLLQITWDPKLPPVMVTGMNPSKASPFQNDPTIVRLLDFAKRWNKGGLIMTNLGAYMATKSRDFVAAEDPFGPANTPEFLIGRAMINPNQPIYAYRYCDVVLGYGTVGNLGKGSARLVERADELVTKFKAAGIHPLCLARNSDGSPKHPLYVPATTALVVF